MKEPQENLDPFSAPVPGHSLTLPQGGSTYEAPPQFANPQDACEYVFDEIVKPRNSSRLVMLLRSGVTCEFIARTMVFTGFQSGKWTPDVGMLIARPVLYMVVAVAQRAKDNGLIKGDFKIMNPDKDQQDFMAQFAELLPNEGSKKEEQKVTKELKNIEATKGPLAFGDM